MLSKSTRKICVDFIKVYFPSADYVILSGSHATNTQKGDSDFDLIVLEYSIDKFKSERIIYLSKLFDVKRIPLNKIDDGLVMDYQDGHAVLTGMLSKGIVIIDHENVAKSLIDLSRERYEIGMKFKDMDYIHKLKIQVQNYLDNLKGITDSKDNTYLTVINLVKKYVDFVLYYHGLWRGNDKMNYEQLEKIEVNFNSDIESAVSEFFDSKNHNKIVTLIERQMIKYGIQTTLNISGPTMNYSGEDYFIMKIVDQEKNIINTLDKFKKQIKLVLKLLNNTENFYFFIPNNLIQGKNISNEIYVIIFQNKDIINKNISTISKKLVEASNNIVDYYAPLSIDISLVFNPCFRLKTFRSFVSKFCKKIFYEKIASKTKAMLIALELTDFTASLTKNTKEFNDYLFKCWFPASYDTGTHLNINALLACKKKKYREFEELFEKQSNHFYSFFAELNKTENYFLNDDLKETLKFFYSENHQEKIFHPFHLTGFNYEAQYIEKEAWCKMKTCLDSIFGSLLIEEAHRSYFPFILNKLNN